MIRKLVAFDTTSRNSNLQIIDFIRDYLASHGVTSQMVFDESGKKANLYATLGPTDRPGIALSGHTDVVPIDGQEWSSDPWTVAERDGRLYGRGTSDMKSFLAITLAMVPEFLARPLQQPIHLIFSYDEEVGCVGVRRLIALLKDFPVKPSAVIIGEPTDMKVIVAHKGKKSVRARVRGLEAHSSLAPKGVNAIEYAAEMIAFLKRMGQRCAKDGPFDEAYDVAHTTVHTGVIHGGTALNIVPKDCYFDFEFRYIGGVDPEAMFGELQAFVDRELLPAMHAVSPDTGISFEEISAFPGLDMPEEADLVVLAKKLAGANMVRKVAFGTEAGLFQQAGWPTIICGPGSIAQAHKPDEWVSLDQLAQCERFMHRLLDRACEKTAA
ncbi:acetylornithine deacetylase [Hypericibacter adhaerens]|jgi:acetylornithine deacetylase